MNYTVNVELYDGRTLPMDATTAERVEELLDRVSDHFRGEVNFLMLSVADTRGGILILTSDQWVRRFKHSLGDILNACDLQLDAGPMRPSLYQELYMKDEQKKGRKHG